MRPVMTRTTRKTVIKTGTKTATNAVTVKC